MFERGATLVETAVATGVVVVVVGISVPLLTTGRHEQRVIDAARFMSGRFMLARASAARRGAAVGNTVRSRRRRRPVPDLCRHERKRHSDVGHHRRHRLADR